MQKGSTAAAIALTNEAGIMPVKITESIFMADDRTANDMEWLTLNQITHVMNCAGKQCPNSKQIMGMSFLTFDWSEDTLQNIIEQRVVTAVVDFIEEAKRSCGTVLIHGCRSQCRPFSLLAIYFMARYQWSFPKTLQFMNSRKEDTEVDSVFYQQLNVFNAKLEERGMIRSRQWTIKPHFSDEQIVLTNTYLNSQNKYGGEPVKSRLKDSKRKRKSKPISWKEQIYVEHLYSSTAVVAHPPPPERHGQMKYLEPKVRSDSLGKKHDNSLSNFDARAPEEGSKSAGKINAMKNMQKAEKSNTILAEMNVTKRWAELRQAWGKEKQNLNSNENSSAGINVQYPEVSRHSEAVQVKKDQKIHDKLNEKLHDKLHDKLHVKLNEKLSFLKGCQGVLRPSAKANIVSIINNQKEVDSKRNDSIDEKKDRSRENLKEGFFGDSTSKQVRTLSNNWIINNQILKDPLKPAKQHSSKSVIMVKPSHATNQSQQEGSRTSLRKPTGSERKGQKEEQQPNRKFFLNETSQFVTQPEKVRSSSVKQQRKDNLLSSAIMKNSSMGGKGKWKL